MKNQPSEEVQKLLMDVVYHFDQEDRAVRDRQVRTARRLKLLWDGFTQTWYSEVAHDWRIFDDTQVSDTDQASYDKPINVFRAYLESIIAALSIIVPPVKCYPDNADDTLDLSTARAGDKIAELLYRHNNVTLLWLHALFIFCTEGMIACYGYPKADSKNGTYEDKKYEDVPEEHEYTKCPECGYEIDDQMVTPEMEQIKWKLEQEKDKFQPDDSDVQLQNAIQGDMDLCPACLQQIIPLIERETLVITRLVGVTQEPKTRVCLEAYGCLYVKIANYARKQEDTPYLVYSYETHYANVIERFEHLHGKFGKEFREKVKVSTGPRSPYEEWARLSTQYQGEYPLDNVTVRNAWLRPAAFNVLPDLADIKKLKKLYPNGAKVVIASDQFGEARNEALDDCWSLSHNPLADYLNHDPLGLLLVSIQEITNDLISLILQTIEHGIGQTFADPGVLNFDAYRQLEATPGGVYEATPKSGKSLGDGFFEAKTATLSSEIMPFAQNIQSLAQLVSGALPSLFGGAIEGSETASQYSMSRAQATQRLQNTWKVLIAFWKEIFGKAIPMFIKETKNQGDERDVKQDKDGNFINVFIRKAELEGKIGKVEIEANENLPLTWSQQKDLIMEIFKAANPQLLAFLTAPENLPLVKQAIGLPDFYIPGEDDRNKQYDEIKILLNSEPIPIPVDPALEMAAQSGDMAAQQMLQMQPQEQSSVEVNPDYDNHAIEFEICRKWVTSEAGRLAKIENEPGYRNVMLHGLEHKQIMIQQMQPQIPPPDGAQGEPNPLEMQEAPITGEGDVTTVQ